MLEIELAGDWIYRDRTSSIERLSALEILLESELNRKIRFTHQPRERQVIVATGGFRFHPPVGTYEDTAVHLYSDEVDPDKGSGGGSADSLDQFLQTLGDQVDMPVINQTQGEQNIHVPYCHHRSSGLSRIADQKKKKQKLELMFKHLTKQTELQFEITT